MTNANPQEGVDEIFKTTAQKISESFDKLEAELHRINMEFKEELIRDLSAILAKEEENDDPQ